MADTDAIAKERDGESESGKRFSVYLLTPRPPSRHAGKKTYVGFTVNPQRRLRQHNGDIKGGARRTTRTHEPWMMVAVVSGFGSQREGLMFEWAWQHPAKSRFFKTPAARASAKAQGKGRGSVTKKLDELRVLLTACEPWKHQGLTVDVLQ